ncbi:RPL10 [Symbiodinium sp. CCMP2592]|nr:RPL10 [Symbiodinium sp. CCMP2592]
MVSLGVPTARFGMPPDPDKPEPHYPGVSSNKFDALGALKVYRENLKRDADIRANQIQLQAGRPGPVHHRRRLEDLMPGLASVAEAYEHLGYSADPITRRMLPPTQLGGHIEGYHLFYEAGKIETIPAVIHGLGAIQGCLLKCAGFGEEIVPVSRIRSPRMVVVAESRVCCLSPDDKALIQKEKEMILSFGFRAARGAGPCKKDFQRHYSSSLCVVDHAENCAIWAAAANRPCSMFWEAATRAGVSSEVWIGASRNGCSWRRYHHQVLGQNVPWGTSCSMQRGS